MPPKASVPVCSVKSCKYFKRIKYQPRCILGRNNRNGKVYYKPCPQYEHREKKKRLRIWEG